MSLTHLVESVVRFQSDDARAQNLTLREGVQLVLANEFGAKPSEEEIDELLNEVMDTTVEEDRPGSPSNSGGRRVMPKQEPMRG